MSGDANARTTEFEQAVRRGPPPVNDAYRPGLQALGRRSSKVRCRRQKRLTGSINLETALSSSSPSANLWDYGIGYRQNNLEMAIWIEMHPAHTSEVNTVLNKLEWLKGWLQAYAVALLRLTERCTGPYWWLTTDGVHIRPGSPQERRLRQSGLKGPQRYLELL